MISFKQFMTETWKIHSAYDVEHNAEVDGHKVNTTFASGKDNIHSIDYTVNKKSGGTTQKGGGGAGPAASKRILKHVADRTDQFIRHAKPKAISLSAYDDRGGLHSAFGKHLARRHGGTHHVEKSGMHVVSFDRKKK